ncbi:hypothetical protein HDV00_006774 [Rhizophlyctis rosea]|nr:hypothetical protein HDV00_006774 [Rhizophlyctis rosea]
MPTLSASEVAKHSSASDAWIIVNGKAYDVTKFADEHPGGKKVLLKVAGQDASKQFAQFHNPSVLTKYGPKLEVGDVGESAGPSAKGAGSGGKEAATGDKTFTPASVAEHSKPSDLWIIVNGKVYDVTKFADEHPGGKKVLNKVAGKDASKEFAQFHNASVLEKYGPKLYVGNVAAAKL